MRRKTTIETNMIVFCLSLATLGVQAGTGNFQNEPLGPTDPASAMFTLSDIYTRLNTRAVVTKRTGGFAEPSAGPTSGTQYTLDEIMTLINNRPPVTKTGQTTVSMTGDDGTYQKGGGWPVPRFTILGGANYPEAATNCVLDNLTGLIWARDANLYGTTNWGSAIATVVNTFNSTSYGGYADWRLPNIRELLSLVNYKYSSPPISDASGTNKWTEALGPFRGVDPWEYWSSTTATDGGGYYVKMGVLNVNSANKSTYKYRVWPVRGPQ